VVAPTQTTCSRAGTALQCSASDDQMPMQPCDHGDTTSCDMMLSGIVTAHASSFAAGSAAAGVSLGTPHNPSLPTAAAPSELAQVSQPTYPRHKKTRCNQFCAD
jgi:hypothetical protein